ncbi:MAG TPA: glycoside hydrolase family 78 protein [Armatimonadota bacterium]|jgi:alpha-L-rhamnosidase
MTIVHHGNRGWLPAVLLAAVAAWGLMGSAAWAALAPGYLRCEFRQNPLGIDVTQPRLSWELQSAQRAEKQTAYQIRVASSLERLLSGRVDLWDSGRVASSGTAHLVYAGRPLASGDRAWWQVRVWDRGGRASTYSPPALWSMGLLKPSDWKASWISLENSAEPDAQKHVLPPSPFLRKAFTLPKPVRRAVLYASALGLYEMHINGLRVGGDQFTPGWTDYRKRVYYNTYDVTRYLSQGRNALGAVLGDGWAVGYVGLGGRERYGVGRPRLLAQLQVIFTDGTTQTVGTDRTWRATEGPIREGDLLMGEVYDAARELRGWDTPGGSDAGWQPVTVHASWSGAVEAYPGVTVRKEMELAPKSVKEPKPGAFVFDLGQNMVGWARLKVKGPAGTRVQLRFAEMLNPDGTIYTTNLRGARCTDAYLCKGGAVETWEPRFTFHGFRYVELTGYPGRPGRDAVTGVVLTSAAPRSGSFTCSSPLVNQIQHNVEWGQRGNFLEVPTDCPQRDERLGWMGDAQIFVRTACDNRDVSAFFTKWMVDVEDAQRDGAFTDVSPAVAGGQGTAAWADAGIVIPWTLYQVYGDTRVLQRHYAAMDRYIRFMEEHSSNLLRPAEGYGDWLSINANTPTDVLATAYFAYSTDLMSRIATALGKSDDASRYSDLFDRIKEAFNRAYVSPDGRIKGDTQTCYVLALHMGLLPKELESKALDYLVADIEAKGWHLSTGFVGTGYLNPTLSRFGRTDVAYRLLNQTTFPSWGFSVNQGATTIWERWDGWTPERGFQDPGMNSFNHYSFGAVDQWIYGTVAGIDTDPQTPGFRHILIRPQPGGGLTHASAAYRSIRGLISSSWRVTGKGFDLAVSIPPNTTATVSVPASPTAKVLEGGKPAERAPGLRYLGRKEGVALYEAGSGSYRFQVR